MPEPDNSPHVLPERCSGCGRCVAACADRLISLEAVGHRKIAVLACPDRCKLCGACRTACPFSAISASPR